MGNSERDGWPKYSYVFEIVMGKYVERWLQSWKGE